MLKVLIFIFISFQTLASNIIFPQDDPYKQAKLEMLDEINDIMGKNGSVAYVQKSDKVILWANEAKILPRYIDDKRTFIMSNLPSFTAFTEQNSARVQQEMTRICQCDLEGKNLGGILIAHPYTAAKMLMRRGWKNYKGTELDGHVPPIVIAYHEFSHIKDYLQNDQVFFDSAARMSKQWANDAERSAVEQQNDFVINIAKKRGLYFARRRSYGANILYSVETPFSVNKDL